MQSVTYQHHSQRLAVPLKTQNHFKPQRRDSIQHRVILAAVREWESTLPDRHRSGSLSWWLKSGPKQMVAELLLINRIYSDI